ncbi:MAG: MerC domain-containing protein [Deltaproteobacteria bacterium]|nr:MerC domain-containing protein [Deltaproteobacteria bacterium]
MQQLLAQPLQTQRVNAPDDARSAAKDGSDAHHEGHEGHAHDGLVDRLGAFLGLACAIHCIAMPLLLGVLPALGLSFLADHVFDLVIVILASIFAFFAARSGLRAHGDRRIVKGFAAAVLLLALGHLVGEESLVGRIPSVLGGLTLATVHFLNLRASRRACRH